MGARSSLCLRMGVAATSLAIAGCHSSGGAAAVDSDAEALDAFVSADAGLTTNVVTLAAGQTGPFSLVLSGGYVFWATANGSVLDVAKEVTDAGLPVTLASSQGVIGALAANGTQLFWTDTTSGTIETLPLAGGLPVHVVSGQANPTGIAVDEANVYWTTGGASGGVFKAPVGGLDGGAPTTLASGQNAPRNLMLSGARLVWSTSSTVVSLPTAGGDATVIASGQTMIASIAVDSGNVYFTTSTALRSVPIAGGTPVTLVGNLASPSGVATDGANVYFLTDGNPTSVASVPIGGGTTTTIDRAGPPMNAPVAIAVDTTSVYWTVDNSTGEFNGLLEKAPK